MKSFVQVSEAAAITTANVNGTHEKLTLEVEITAPGYLLTTLSHDAPENVDVYFDDYTIIHEHGRIVQVQDYYPYGLPFNTKIREHEVLNTYLYQGKELLDSLGRYDFHARMYDPALGRFLGADPAGQFHSPYAGMGNNPVIGVDPDGRKVWPWIVGEILTGGALSFTAANLSGSLVATTSGLIAPINGPGAAIAKQNYMAFTTEEWKYLDPTYNGTPTGNYMRILGGLFQTDASKGFLGRAWQLISRFTWESPQTALGNAISNTFNLAGMTEEVNYFRGATVIANDFGGRNGAFTVGSYINGPKNFSPDFRDHLFVHEYGHYLQSKRMGPFYLPLVALPSVTDSYLPYGNHSERWYESHASRLAANYFDEEFGSKVEGYTAGSVDFFDKNSFANDGTLSPYQNPRNNGFNDRGHPMRSRFHRSDIPISLLYNGGFGLLGYW